MLDLMFSTEYDYSISSYFDDLYFPHDSCRDQNFFRNYFNNLAVFKSINPVQKHKFSVGLRGRLKFFAEVEK